METQTYEEYSTKNYKWYFIVRDITKNKMEHKLSSLLLKQLKDSGDF